MIKYMINFLMIILSIGVTPVESSTPCRLKTHRFNAQLNECIYCAQGLKYDDDTLKCLGISDTIGKCVGDDHYHAATQECMYCATGYTFNNQLRICTQ